MKRRNRRQLAGLTWVARSPSLLEQWGAPVALHFDGKSWLVSVRGVTGIREFASREEAAELVASAWRNVEAECRI